MNICAAPCSWRQRPSDTHTDSVWSGVVDSNLAWLPYSRRLDAGKVPAEAIACFETGPQARDRLEGAPESSMILCNPSRIAVAQEGYEEHRESHHSVAPWSAWVVWSGSRPRATPLLGRLQRCRHRRRRCALEWTSPRTRNGTRVESRRLIRVHRLHAWIARTVHRHADSEDLVSHGRLLHVMLV